MLKDRKKCWLIGVVGLLWAFSAFGEQGVTPGQIVFEWRKMSGGVPAKVVYWKSNSIRVIDLTTGNEKVVVSGVSGGTDGAPCCCWSPDGRRIGYRDKVSRRFMVVYEDGSNKKPIGVPRGHFFSWHDNDTVCLNLASPKDEIVLVDVNAGNNVTKTTVIVKGPSIGGKYRDYITASGDYVSWMDGDMNPDSGRHNCPIQKISTGEMRYAVPRAPREDSCSSCLKPDGSGTLLYNHNNHKRPLEMKNWAGKLLGTLSAVSGGEIYYARWSNHSDYIAHVNHAAPSARTQGYIRKISTGKHISLGAVWGPDIWVQVGRVSRPRRKVIKKSAPPKVKREAPSDEDKAAKMLKVATDMMKDKQFMRMNRATIKAQLKRIMDTYPDTQAAGEAKKLLEQM